MTALHNGSKIGDMTLGQLTDLINNLIKYRELELADANDHHGTCDHSTEVMMEPDVRNITNMWTCLACGNRRYKI